jgi:hypothetical protein
MLLTTTPSERIGRCTRMRRFLVRSNGPESFVHTRYSADFTIITSGFEFSVHTGIPTSYRAHDAEWGERFFHLTDPDDHELSFARPLLNSSSKRLPFQEALGEPMVLRLSAEPGDQ